MHAQGSATALRPALVAAHQVLWQVWNLCAFGHTPMEQAALAFLPGIENRQEYKEWVKLLAGVGLFVGIVTALLATGVPYYLPFLFTPDVELWPIMKSIAPQVRAHHEYHACYIKTRLQMHSCLSQSCIFLMHAFAHCKSDKKNLPFCCCNMK